MSTADVRSTEPVVQPDDGARETRPPSTNEDYPDLRELGHNGFVFGFEESDFIDLVEVRVVNTYDVDEARAVAIRFLEDFAWNFHNSEPPRTGAGLLNRLARLHCRFTDMICGLSASELRELLDTCETLPTNAWPAEESAIPAVKNLAMEVLRLRTAVDLSLGKGGAA